jgi:hypothetical protein
MCGRYRGHREPSALKKQHRKALELSGVMPCVFYSLRHTCLTRLGAECGDPWKVAKIAGQSQITMSMRYVHRAEESVQIAMEGVSKHKTGYKQQKAHSKKKRATAVEPEAGGGHNFGHSPENSGPSNKPPTPATTFENNLIDGGQCRTRTCDLLLVRQAL